MNDRERVLRTELSHAIELADGEAIEAVSDLIYAVARYLDIDENDVSIGAPLDGEWSMWAPTDGYVVDDLQAVEPDSLTRVEGIHVEIASELDSQGFHRVAVFGPTHTEVLAYVIANWGRDDPDWLNEYVDDRIRPVKQ